MTERNVDRAGSVSDPYPSRFAGETTVLPRIDPVTYFDRPAPDAVMTLQDFERDGYCWGPDIFDDEEVDTLFDEAQWLRHEATRLRPPEATFEPHDGDLRSLFRVQDHSPRFRELMRDPRLLAVVGAILNDRVYLHQTRLSFEPPFRGNALPWHSAFETWHAEDGMPAMRAVTIAIFLTDITAINGSLMVLPGSHKQFVSCPGETPREHYKHSLVAQRCGVPDDAIVYDLASFYGVSMPTGPAGSMLVLDCNLLHGANGNISPMPRATLFLVYNAFSNRLQSPFCGRPPRPEFLAARSELLMVI